jgi:sirohydrochlorin cobaltochelatase
MKVNAATLQGIVLFAHGSRDPLWHQPIEAVARQIGVLDPSAKVSCAYLELSSPTLEVAVQNLLMQGVSAIRIVPLFLGVGKHAREDLPLLVYAIKQQHPEIEVTLQAAVGQNTKLVRLMAEIALEMDFP